MKNLLYIVPMLGLLCFVSCDKDESDEIVDEVYTIDQGEIKIQATTNNKVFPRGIAPGLYGPMNVDAYTSVVYTLIPHQDILNTIPSENRRYRIAFEKTEDTSYPYSFTQIAYFENIANAVTVQFPSTTTNPPSNKTLWRVTYEISDLYQSNFHRYKKYVSVDNN